ncbi:MAG: non-lysosomal glucosylceramidase [Candidatus Aminicenantes bacterium]|nr:non-lysosomal glucosylceramidase [Candidatus Aminicenantes bacterium]MDH5383943.1 non-lysosomal glucosylceramidase [Candidatus Aminicenantes bacterium]MDH5744331.1 non-lysosomal glucosylceramidase [Candidatus Aminicenantes bacterium]
MRLFIFNLVALFILGNLAMADTAYKKEDLYTYGQVKTYTGKDLQTIAFPIGGLGTGNINLGGRGDIRELEIFNRPSKGVHPDMTFFSIWIQEEGKKPVAKILERKLIPPYVGWMGFPRNQLAGVSRFDEVTFKGEYPLAFLGFEDPQISANVNLEAYNPFVPLSPEKSGIPAAIFNWKIKNNQSSRIKVSLAFSMLNPIKTLDKNNNAGFGKNLNQYIDEDAFRGVKMTSNRAKPDDLEYGSVAVVTTAKDVDVQTRWYRGGWWDNAHMFWDDFSDDGRIQQVNDSMESDERQSDVASLLVHCELNPGEEMTIPFWLIWYFPNRDNHWNREEEVRGKKFRNHYATIFHDAWDVARHLVSQGEELYKETMTFHDLLFQSSYPSYLIDAISSQSSSLKTNLVMRSEDGKLFGFEGLTDDKGCCPMNCTHVWNYEQTLAYLFPSLERTVRETDFLHNTFDNGYQVFRTLMPLGEYLWTFKPCADGQMGNIVRVFREWKLSGDIAWLKKLWPKVKAALEFAWKGVGDVGQDLNWQKERLLIPWDPDKDGVMEGEQHNTYDIEYYGPNTMTGSLYLTALKACSEMAEAVGEPKKAKEYSKIYQQGSKEYDSLLWNGEYYIQIVDVMEGLVVPEHLRSPEKGCTNPECKGKESPGGNKKALEAGDVIPKYQYGEGCLSDQLLGQYLAHVAGLGYILEKGHVDKAMESIFRYNFRRNLGSFSNVQRVYALNDEAGLLLCSWPKGNRPALPFVYSDEVWTGIEYQVAASLVYSGYVDEGLSIVKAVRDRHRGFNRNPWDEFECGHHYARAMASWAVMLALSGYQYDGLKNSIAFSPKIKQNDFSTFWSSGSGWGNFRIKEDEARLRVEYGSLTIKELGLSKDYAFKSVQNVRMNSEEVKAKLEQEDGLSVVTFVKPVILKRGEEISIKFSK